VELSLTHITKRFGSTLALDDVSLALVPGERLAVVGENGAGKSSLMNVLYGLYQPDAGEVRFDGEPTRLRSPADALHRGVGMVHQHFTLVPTLTVAENVVLGAEPVRGFTLDLHRAADEVAKTCARLGFQLDPHATVRSLSVGSQQKVEIVKALHRGARTLILDEPTAVLTPQEADELFAVTRSLSEAGLTVVLISHKLPDVLAFATRIAVMRRGRLVATVTPGETSADALAELMVGTRPEAPPPHAASTPGAVLLSTEAVSAQGLHEVTLEVRAGEIVGLAGVDGNGQRELAEVLTGLRPFTSGLVTLAGQRLYDVTPARARTLGVAHIPEDRLHRAVVADLSVEENLSLGRTALPPFAKGPLIDFAGRRQRTVEVMERQDVRPREPWRRLGDLSGGNQQKLVVGRELDAAPKVLVVVQPTRGLDIAAVAAVRERLLEARAGGAAVLLVSLDLDEVLNLADRVLVMCGGRVNATFDRGAFDERRIGRAMLGVADA
jgi:simple sugar transport system ATP-binding protein